MADREIMTDDDVASAVKAMVDSSSFVQGGTLSSIRANNLSTYFRHPYREDAEAAAEDRSTTIDSTAADTVDWMMAQLVRTFVGGERVVSFIPNGPDDVEQAEIEMDVVDHILNVQNDGYVLLHNWIWDGLVTDVGYVKAYRDERVIKEVQEYSGQTEDDLTALIADFEADGATVEIISQVENRNETVVDEVTLQTSPELQEQAQIATEVLQLEDGSVQIINQTYDVRLRITHVKRGIKVIPIPGDEVIVPNGWTDLSLQDAPYSGHRAPQTVSDLVAQGFDPEQIEKLPSFDASELGEERQRRHDDFDIDFHKLSPDSTTQEKTVTEAYVRLDRDGDGFAELLKVVMGGDEILSYTDDSVAIEEIEEVPIHCWSPYMIPHRHQGEGVVSRTEDIQRNKTATERNLMDNMAFVSNPRTVIGKDAIGPDTIDDALTYRPGGLIRAGDASQVVPFKLPSIIGDTLPVLEYWDQRKEERTGVTRYNQGMDADSLNKTATGLQMIKEAGLDKVEMIARNLAETGFKSLIQHIHALLRRHQDKELEIEVAGRWIVADPRAWGERSNLKVGVGLGSGSRERKQLALEAVIGRQAELLTNGVPLTDVGKLYNAVADWSKSLGMQDPTRYFTDVDNDPNAQQAGAQEDEASSEQTLAEAQVEAARLGAVAKLEDVRAKAAASERADRLKLVEMQVKDDRERDIALLKVIGDLERAGMQAEVAELRRLLTPDALANVGQQA